MKNLLLLVWAILVTSVLWINIELNDEAEARDIEDNQMNEMIFELLDGQCMRDMKRGNPESDACKYAVKLEKKLYPEGI